MAKPKLRLQAREMRQSGLSIKHIAKTLGIAQSSTSLWCRDIKLSEEQISCLQKNARDPYYGKRLQNVLRQQQIRIEKTDRLREEGIQQIGLLNSRELFLVGTALYWAEGFKKDNQAGLCSSDPKMMKFYVKWLQKCFGYKINDLLFRITLNANHEYRVTEITNYWAKLFNISENNFQKPFFQHVKWKKQYDKPENYFGVLRVRVRRSADLLRKIHGYIEGLRINS